MIKRIFRKNKKVLSEVQTESLESIVQQKKKSKIKFSIFDKILIFSILCSVVCGISVAVLFQKLSISKIDLDDIVNYKPSCKTIIYDEDGDVISEIAREDRVFVPIDQIPSKLQNAFIAAEDKSFYSNIGIDLLGMLRASIQNIFAFAKKDKSKYVGASTITQQVVRNVVLTNEKTITRKLKEIILSLKLTTMISKERIMEIYLNQIYLGARSYGVFAAAHRYFNKDLSELTLAECATLAALPKAPSSIDPTKNPTRALARRNWVLERMFALGFITKNNLNMASKSKMEVAYNKDTTFGWAFVEYVKSVMIKNGYDMESLESESYKVYTSMRREWQKIAQEELDNALEIYSKKHGYKGPIAKLNLFVDWKEDLQKIPKPVNIGNFEIAVVKEVFNGNTNDNTLKFFDQNDISDNMMYANIFLQNGTEGRIEFKDMSWAKAYISPKMTGKIPRNPSDILSVGDVIVVQKTDREVEKSITQEVNGSLKGRLDYITLYKLEQLPDINGAVVMMSPKDGRIFAMVGAYKDIPVAFNRAFQAKRQVGSAIKPFIYLSALERGFTPADVFMDAEISFNIGEGESWNPQNDTKTYTGPVTLRTGLERSLNTVTIRTLQSVGLGNAIKTLKKFNFLENYPKNLTLALGSGESTVLGMAKAYSIISNGGKYIVPSAIVSLNKANKQQVFTDRGIVDKDEEFVNESGWVKMNQPRSDEDLVTTKTSGLQIIDPEVSYQAIYMLQGVVKIGAVARRSAAISDMNFGGKTGTSQDGRDLWFAGITPDVVTVVYVGYDKPQETGNEYGGTTALPIFVNIMNRIRGSVANTDFHVPEGIRFIKINKANGKRTNNTDSSTFFEAFKSTDNLPSFEQNYIEQEDDSQDIEISGVY